jgi:hypothetical protein
VGVEAISWALNLTPIPRDRGGKQNPACKAVLVGLANHAAPDGKDAFPSVRTLVRYTDLSERTVRTALDRLEADGIIRPCAPAVVAAKIKRADQRPQGWDLAMYLIRDDLDDDELAALESQFRGLTAPCQDGRGAGATGMINLSAWPAGSRLILRKERPHPGAQLTFTDVDGHRITAFLTGTPPGVIPARSPGWTAAPPARPRRGPHQASECIRLAEPAGARRKTAPGWRPCWPLPAWSAGPS